MKRNIQDNLWNEHVEFIRPGMLSSPQIKLYIKHGKLIKIPPGTEDKICFKSATYDMRLGDSASRFEHGNKKIIKLGKTDVLFPRIHSELLLPPNSLTFVTTHEEFDLPKDVVARFNLKGKFIHKGLLLGTGPIVDPEFQGKLLIPIHNFSSEPVSIEYLEPFIAVEFTKTLPPLPESDYVENINGNGDFNNYLKKLGTVESSVFKEIERIKSISDSKEKRAYLTLGATIFGLFAVLIGICQLFGGINERLDLFNSNSNDYQNKKVEFILEHYANELKQLSNDIELLKNKIEKLENKKK